MEDREITLVEGETPDCPLTHVFSDGVYSRTVFMPKDSLIIGKVHKTKHLNIILSGKARVWINGEVKDVGAPDIIESGVGVMKVLYILEDMYWTTIHVTDTTDLDELEEELIEPLDYSTLQIDNIIKGLIC